MNLDLNITDLRTTPQFASNLAAWLHEEWYRYRGEEVARVQDRMLASHSDQYVSATFVAFVNDQPVGTFTLEESNDSLTGLTLFCLSNVFVAPALRGHGIGRQLCHTAIEETRRRRIPILSLFTVSHAAYYAALGWKYVNIVPMSHRGQDDLATQMRRRVNLG